MRLVRSLTPAKPKNARHKGAADMVHYTAKAGVIGFTRPPLRGRCCRCHGEGGLSRADRNANAAFSTASLARPEARRIAHRAVRPRRGSGAGLRPACL